MTRLGWSAGVLAFGTAAVGTTFACAFAAFPGRAWVHNWPWYALLLLAPYILCAVGCRWCATGRVVRIATVLACVAGTPIAVLAVEDVRTAITNGKTPDIPASAFVAGVVLIPQYYAGLTALLAGYVGWYLRTPASSSGDGGAD